jgi:hypothetical protein
MNIYCTKRIWLVALPFIVGCQPHNPLASPQQAVSNSTVSNAVLNEQTQVTHPQSKIHVATVMSSQPLPLNAQEFTWEEQRCFGSHSAVPDFPVECELGTLKLSNDNCFYVELDSGEKVLPILISGHIYLPPEKLAAKYTSWLGKKVIGYYGNRVMDLKSAEFNASSIGWVTPPPHQQCAISQAHQYARFMLNEKYTKTDSVDGQDNLTPTLLNSLKREGKLPYMGVYDYGTSLGDEFIAGRKPVAEGIFFIEKDCLYIRFKDGQVGLPVFKTRQTFWQDAKNTLMADGRNWHLGESYFFGMSSSWSYDPKITGMVIPPHSSCNTKQVRYVHSIYEPAEFK